MLTAMGASRFADRAARELQATGERVSKRAREPSAQQRIAGAWGHISMVRANAHCDLLM